MLHVKLSVSNWPCFKWTLLKPTGVRKERQLSVWWFHELRLNPATPWHAGKYTWACWRLQQTTGIPEFMACGVQLSRKWSATHRMMSALELIGRGPGSRRSPASRRTEIRPMKSAFTARITEPLPMTDRIGHQSGLRSCSVGLWLWIWESYGKRDCWLKYASTSATDVLAIISVGLSALLSSIVILCWSTMESIITTLCERLERLIDENPLASGRRILVAFAGIPGSGKTTVSAALMKTFNQKRPGSISVLPMVKQPFQSHLPLFKP